MKLAIDNLTVTPQIHSSGKSYVIPLTKGNNINRSIYLPLAHTVIEGNKLMVNDWLLLPDKDLPRLTANGFRPINGEYVGNQTPATEPSSYAAPQAAPVIQKGFFTVQDDSGHRTYRVRMWKEKAVISLMRGQSNTSDYIGFGFIDGNELKIWRRCEFDREMLARDFAAIIGDPQEAGLRYARESKNCMRCNRLLTEPTSLDAGIGPECRGLGFGASRAR
jgi:hypothetical protein